MKPKAIKAMHEQMMYPCVQVRTTTAGGSGTVVYSRANREDGHSTYILTNHHVVASAITFNDEWDANVGRTIKKESRKPVQVSFFKYARLSWLQGQETVEADIVAWDKPQDLALLKLRSEAQSKYVANLYPKDKIRDLRIGMNVGAVGCSMLHKPLLSPPGSISSLDEMVDNLRYWMTNTSIIFGNSGGAMYLVDTGEFIGIPSRLDVALLGFSADPIPFLNYIIPVARIYDWLEETCHQFIFDEDYTEEQCDEMRKAQRDELQQAWEQRFRREREIAQGG